MSFFPAFVTYTASAAVRPARILNYGVTEAKAAEATGTTIPFIGISANRFKYPPNSFEAQAIPYLAETGDGIDYRAAGQVADCLCGAAITDLRTPVTSDGAGRAITANLSVAGVNYYVGMPLNLTANANEIVRVLVAPGINYHA